MIRTYIHRSNQKDTPPCSLDEQYYVQSSGSFHGPEVWWGIRKIRYLFLLMSYIYSMTNHKHTCKYCTKVGKICTGYIRDLNGLNTAFDLA